MHSIRGFVEELKDLSKKLETKEASERDLKVSPLAYFIPAGKRQAMPVAIQIAPRACCGKSPKPPWNTDFQSVAARSCERF